MLARGAAASLVRPPRSVTLRAGDGSASSTGLNVDAAAVADRWIASLAGTI